VCRNGVTLDTSEYTASNGTSVVLTVAAGTGDIVDITAFKSFTVGDTYTKGEVDGFSVKLTGAQTVAGVKTFSNQPVFSAGIDLSSNGQVKFPATQSASTDANTLDDYEEGTWTPNVQNTSSSSTFSTKTGRYTKIGRFVYCCFLCDGGNSGTAGGSLVISGLPFTYGGTNNVPTLTCFTANGLPNGEYVTSRTQNGSTSIDIRAAAGGANITTQLSFVAGTIVYEV